MTWLHLDWRGLLARLPLPMLALAASWGVYGFSRRYVPEAIAVIQAAAFELTYIGLAVARGLTPAQRRRATAISIGAVVVSVVYNAIDGLFARNPAWLLGLSWQAEIAGAILHGAPLAVVAYLVADLLLHSQPAQASKRPAQLRATTRRLARLLRQARALEGSSGAMLAQVQAELAQVRDQAARDADAAARLAAELAHTRAGLAQAEQEAAQLRASLSQSQHAHATSDRELNRLARELELAQASAALDVLRIARVLQERGMAWREIGQLLGVSDSTLRSRLKAASNGHAIEASEV